MTIIEHFANQIDNIVRSTLPDLTMRQTAVALTVWRAGPVTVRGLAASLHISKPVVTRAITRLSELGLVCRVEDPSDGRSILVVSGPNAAIHWKDFEQFLTPDQ